MDFRNRRIDLVGKQNLWFAISLAVILVGLLSWLAFGLNLGVDFRGGGQLQYRIAQSQRPQTGEEAGFLDRVRTELEAKGLRGVRPQIVGGDTLVINTLAKNTSEVEANKTIVTKALGTELGANPTPLSSQFVGPVIGEELRRNAILGVLLGVTLIAGWIYIRYNFAGDGLRYAVAGIAALVHDVLVLIGLFALIGKIDPRVEIDGSFIAALLTVVGYSINDSVVIFDRVRENLRTRRREGFYKVVNDSLLETMSRSINTGLTVIIMLLVLLFFGGESIYNFVLAMLVGIVSGLYSSIFNASMVLVAWHRHDEKKAYLARSTGGRTVSSSSRDVPRRAPLQGGARPALSTAGGTPSVGAGASGQFNTPRREDGARTMVIKPIQSEPIRAEATDIVPPAAGPESASPLPETEVATNIGAQGEAASDAAIEVTTGKPAAHQPSPPRKSRSRRRY